MTSLKIENGRIKVAKTRATKARSKHFQPTEDSTLCTFKSSCGRPAEYISDNTPGAYCQWHKHLLSGHTEKI